MLVLACTAALVLLVAGAFAATKGDLALVLTLIVVLGLLTLAAAPQMLALHAALEQAIEAAMPIALR